MPRSKRGGSRAGAPGKSYAQRSDLPGKVLPVTAAPDQPYGVAGAQRAQQASLPMSTPPVVAAAPAPVGGPVQGGGTSSPSSPAPATSGPPDLSLPPGMPLPGSIPGLDAPTARPDEPLTHGAPVGPGGGPEVLPPLFAHPVLQGVAILNAMGTSSPQVAGILKAANAALANQAAL